MQRSYVFCASGCKGSASVMKNTHANIIWKNNDKKILNIVIKESVFKNIIINTVEQIL